MAPPSCAKSDDDKGDATVSRNVSVATLSIIKMYNKEGVKGRMMKKKEIECTVQFGMRGVTYGSEDTC